MNINRDKFVQQLMAKHNYTKKAATALVEDFIDMVIANFEAGNTVTFYGFGTFELKERKERSCPNPQTGETCVIPAHYVPKFHPGKQVKLAVKKWESEQNRSAD